MYQYWVPRAKKLLNSTQCKKAHVNVQLSLSIPGRHIEGEEVQLHSFTTSKTNGGEWTSSCLGFFTTGEITLLPIYQETGWAPEPVWIFWRKESSSTYTGPNPTLSIP
jgi:hypothetical protein